METTTTVKFNEDTEQQVDKILGAGVYQALHNALLALKEAKLNRAFFVCKDETVRLY